MYCYTIIGEVLKGLSKCDLNPDKKTVVLYELHSSLNHSLCCFFQEPYYWRMQRGREKMDKRRMGDQNQVSCSITMIIFWCGKERICGKVLIFTRLFIFVLVVICAFILSSATRS